jgi:hypothetical protein
MRNTRPDLMRKFVGSAYDSLDAYALIPFPNQDDLTMEGKDVIDLTSFGLRWM